MQMSLTKRAMGHFKTITYHKWLVMKGCFAVGLYRQGLIHDLVFIIIREIGAPMLRSGKKRAIPVPGSIIRDGISTIMNTGVTWAKTNIWQA